MGFKSNSEIPNRPDVERKSHKVRNVIIGAVATLSVLTAIGAVTEPTETKASEPTETVAPIERETPQPVETETPQPTETIAPQPVEPKPVETQEPKPIRISAEMAVDMMGDPDAKFCSGLALLGYPLSRTAFVNGWRQGMTRKSLPNNVIAPSANEVFGEMASRC